MPKKKKGRPPEKIIKPIKNATPEEVAYVIMQSPPKKTWRYEKPKS